MAENSAIEWTHHTVNFWWGCAKVSPACAHCYAEGQAARFYPGLWGADGERRIRIEAARREAFRYERQAAKEGRRLRVFTNSMADFFEDRRDLDLPRLEALDVIRQTPHLDWMILTKRPERIMDLLRACLVPTYRQERYELNGWLEEWFAGNPPANVWLGTTVEDQERADQRIPHLLKAPAAIRFVSMEPLLGPVNLCGLGVHKGWCPTHDFRGGFCHGPCPDDRRLDWVICGGESGRQARPMHPDWARSLRDQCAAAGVPFLFKQWGEWGASHEHLATGEPRFCVFRDFDHWANKGSSWMRKGDLLLDARGVVMHCGYDIRNGKEPFTALRKVGKKAAGRLLDGQLHDAYPEVPRG